MKKKIDINKKCVGVVWYVTQRGITLIALILTIILLLILAGVTINVILGDNGLFNKARMASGKYGQAEEREKLEIVLVDLQADKLTKPEYNENEYINKRLNDNGMEVDGNIVIVEEWQFEIDRSVPKIAKELERISKEERLKPRITKIETIVNGSKVNISVNAKNVDTVKYILQKEGKDEIIDQSEEIQDLNYVFNDLETSTTYVITVEAKNEYGVSNGEATIKIISLSELTQGKATFDITPNTRWQASVTARIDSSYSDNSTIIQYRKGTTGEWTPYNGEFEVTKNETLYGRYYNSTTEEVGYAFTLNVDVIDDIPPVLTITNETIGSKTIEVTVSAVDHEIGMSPSATYQYNIRAEGENYPLTAPVGSNKFTYTSLKPSTDYYVMITVNDLAGNQGSVEKKITTSAPILVSKITLNKTEADLATSSNNTVQLSAAVEPSNAEDKTVTWTSSNTSVATVSNTGFVTAKGAGIATITCSSKDGGASATCNVTVYGGLIYTRADLENIKVDTTASYKLMNDIDLSGKNWTPINRFSGTLDGNGHVISNMTISPTESEAQNYGFFKTIDYGATVKNIMFDSPTINNVYTGAGVIAGGVNKTTAGGYAPKGHVLIERVGVKNGQLIGIGSNGSMYYGSFIGRVGDVNDNWVCVKNSYANCTISRRKGIRCWSG